MEQQSFSLSLQSIIARLQEASEDGFLYNTFKRVRVTFQPNPLLAKTILTFCQLLIGSFL